MKVCSKTILLGIKKGGKDVEYALNLTILKLTLTNNNPEPEH
jgi:hypothetical protein